MKASDAKLRASLAAPALALALFQCWYAYLPDAEAVRFSQCRLNEHLDCYKSLSLHGAMMPPRGIPVLPTLATIYLGMVLLLAGAALSDEPRRTSWRTWSALLAFPAAGLSIHVLLHDWQVAGASSLSSVLILGLGLSLCVLTVVRGVAVSALKGGALGFVGWMVLAVAGGFLIQGGGYSRLVAREIEIEREGEPAQLRWSRFAHSLPRVGAAHLGSPTARRELLLFVDPAEPSSRALMRAAAKLAPRLGESVALYFYAPNDPRLLRAAKVGKLAAFLADPDSTPDFTGTASGPFERQKAAVDKLGLARYPAAWWRDDRRDGEIDLPALVNSLRKG